MLTKRIVSVFLSLVIIVISARVSVASSISINEGKFAGEKIGYYFNIPKELSGLIAAERVPVNPGSTVVESFRLFCVPASGTNEARQTLITVSIYKKLAWTKQDDMQEIFRTKDYVFVAYFSNSSGFRQSININSFNFCLNYLKNNLAGLFTLPNGQNKEYTHRVFVNDRPLSGQMVEAKQSGQYLLPLREILELLGYKVDWVADECLVIISKDDFRDSFVMLSNTQYARGHSVKLIDNKTYMALGYFVIALGIKSLEIDSNKNVYIRG